MLAVAIDSMQAILQGTEDHAIGKFNSSHPTITDGLHRSGEVKQALTPGVCDNLAAAKKTLRDEWSFLATEPDLAENVRAQAASLADLLEQETFFGKVRDIAKCREIVRDEYQRRFEEALTAKVAAYRHAVDQLEKSPPWVGLTAKSRAEVSAPLRTHARDDGSTQPRIPQLRADRDACTARLRAAIDAAYRIVDGDRIIKLDLQLYFRDGVEDNEQLEAALDRIREKCLELIAGGKKIIIG